MAKVGVIGTTSWGTTLAIVLARRNMEVCLWARTEEEAASLRSHGRNPRSVPDAHFPRNLRVTASRPEAFHQVDFVIIAVPSKTLRHNVQQVRDHLDSSTVVMSATKGLELDTGKRMSEVLWEELPSALHRGICAMSGPNLAMEVVQGKPSSTVIASESAAAAAKAQMLMNSPRFRVYTNDDIIGVEYCGALKNIIALGAGICDGLRYGDNTKAAFITRGLAEITRLGVAAGASPLTFAGLAGMGDLIATCSSRLSRNHYVGEQLAKGRSLPEIRATMRSVAEGLDTTAAAITLAETLGVEMPIVQATYDVLFNGVPLGKAISELLGRAPRSE